MLKKLLPLLLLPLPALATITHGGSNANVTARGGSTPAPIAIPAGAGAGDAMIIPAFVKGDDAGEAITTPSGWTLLHTGTATGTGTSLTLYVFCKVHDGSETDPELATTGTGTGDVVGGELYYINTSGHGFNCASIEAHANQQGNAAATNIAHPALTITTPNTYVLAFGVKAECENCVFNTLATDGLGWVEASDSNGTAGEDWSMVGDYVIQTTATSISSGSFTVSAGDESQISASILIALQEVPTTATFTAGPAQVGVTASTVQVSFTSDTTGIVEGVACADGSGTPSASQVLADQCNGGGAAVASFDEVVTGGVADSATFTGLSASTTYDTFYVIDAAVDSTVASLANQTTSAGGGASPGFDSGPILSSCSATGCTFDYNANADADHIHGMCVSTAESTPTAAAIEAATGSNGDADEASTGAADTLTITFTDSPVFPIYNCHFTAEEGTSNYSAVVSVLSVTPDAPASMAFWPILSVGTGSPCEFFNTEASPDIAANDWLLTDAATSPGSFALTVSSACQYSYPGDTSPQSVLDTAVYDASAGGWHAEDLDVWFNNNAPVCNNEVVQRLVLDEDSAMDAIDLDDSCVDPDVEALTYAVTTGTLNAGLTLTGATGVLNGTPTTENEAGNAVTITATDGSGATSSIDFLIYVVNTWTVPDCDDVSASDCSDLIVAAAPWREADVGLVIGDYICGSGQDFLNVADQDPNAAAEAGAFDEITVNLVGAVIPDTSGMTAAEAIAAIEAICP